MNVIEKKAMTGNAIPYQQNDSVIFFENICKKRPNISKNLAKNVLGNRSRALNITTNITISVAIRNPKNVLSTLPEVINFYHRGEGFTWGKLFDFIPSKWSKKQIQSTHQNH